MLSVKKSNNSFYLYIDYFYLNNVTIKNQYQLLQNSKLVDKLYYAK